MRLIITRPAQDAIALAEKLKARGHDAILAPLMEIMPRPGVVLPAENFQGVCVTSANALCNRSINTQLLQLPVYCVGPQSAKAARQEGFAQVSHHGGDVAGLAQHLRQNLKPADGPLLYLSGAETSGDLAGELTGAGFNVTRLVCYDAVALPLTLPAADIEGADGVLLYSPRLGKLWQQDIARRGLALPAHFIHFCLSANVAKTVPDAYLRKVARTPDEGAMLSLLDQSTEAE